MMRASEPLEGKHTPEAALRERGAALRRAGEAVMGKAQLAKGGDGFSRREALLVALDELFECHFHSIPPETWRAAEAAFKAAQSELQCPDGCDTSCPCYQAGLEAQRERVGGGTA